MIFELIFKLNFVEKYMKYFESVEYMYHFFMSPVSISLHILYTPALVLSAYHLVHVSPSENEFLFN